jgi:hypothetical protein
VAIFARRAARGLAARLEQATALGEGSVLSLPAALPKRHGRRSRMPSSPFCAIAGHPGRSGYGQWRWECHYARVAILRGARRAERGLSPWVARSARRVAGLGEGAGYGPYQQTLPKAPPAPVQDAILALLHDCRSSRSVGEQTVAVGVPRRPGGDFAWRAARRKGTEPMGG